MWDESVESFIAMYLYKFHEDLYVDWLCEHVKDDRPDVWRAISAMTTAGKARLYIGKGREFMVRASGFPRFRSREEDSGELAQWEVDAVLRSRLEGSQETTPSDDLLFLRAVDGVSYDDCFSNG